MTTTRVYFPRTTAQQRRLLFTVWQETGDIALACQKAHVSQRTFYNWKPRFDLDGFPGVAHAKSHAALEPHRVDPAIAAEVIALRQAHPSWGKVRLAQEMSKAHDWQAVLAPNSVRRILRDAGLWRSPPQQEAEKGGRTS